jgi:uncharacterized membrane protein YfcA
VEFNQIALLVGGGLVAGIVNTLAGGGSLLTVPLLVLLGLPGGLANGSNRVGIAAQSLISVFSFRALGFREFRSSLSVLAPLLTGSAAGALLVSELPDEVFERAFGVVMLLLLVPTFFRRPKIAADGAGPRPWSRTTSSIAFFAIGAYGGAFQAGVGLLLLLGLARAGFDLVRANVVKVIVVAALTAVALPVFIAKGQVAWLPAGFLAVGFSAGGALGAQLAVRGGERLIRPVVAAAVVVLATKMLGLL